MGKKKPSLGKLSIQQSKKSGASGKGAAQKISPPPSSPSKSAGTGKRGAQAKPRGIKNAEEVKPDIPSTPKGTGNVQKYEVGIFDDLQKRSAVGDKLDIHHVGQKHPSSQVINGYDPQLAPSIAVSFREHKRIPTIKGDYTGSVRDLLAKDIWDLRRHTNAPNSALKELITLNKSMYPDSFRK